MKRVTVTLTDELEEALESMARDAESSLGLAVSLSNTVRGALVVGLKQLGRLDADYKLSAYGKETT